MEFALIGLVAIIGWVVNRVFKHLEVQSQEQDSKHESMFNLLERMVEKFDPANPALPTHSFERTNKPQVPGNPDLSALSLFSDPSEVSAPPTVPHDYGLIR